MSDNEAQPNPLEDEIRFINAVKNRPLLYDKNAGKGMGWQSKVTLTMREWDNIAKQFGMHDRELAIKRWRYFRDRFVREFRLRSKNSGKLPKNATPWIHYEEMKFVEKHVRNRSNINYFDEDSKSNKIELEFINTDSTTSEFPNIINEIEAEENSNKDKQIQHHNIDGLHDDGSIDNYDDNNKFANKINTISKNKTKCKNIETNQSPKITKFLTKQKKIKIEPEQYQQQHQEETNIMTVIQAPKRKFPQENNNLRDPDYYFALYMASEMRQMTKKRKNELKALVVNFILADENDDIEQTDVFDEYEEN